MASALYENIEDCKLSRDSENMDHFDGIVNEMDPKQHSVTVTNELNADTETVKENGHHHNGLYGFHKEPEDKREKDDDCNDEPGDNEEETGCEETTPVPCYGKTLLAPEYMNFQIPDDASKKEENDTENNNTNDAAVAAYHSETDQVREEERTTGQTDQTLFKEEENEDGCDENGEGNSGTDDGIAMNEGLNVTREEEESAEVLPRLAQSEEDDDELSEDDGDDVRKENNEVNREDGEEKDEDGEERSEDGGVDENDEEDREYDEKERDDEVEEEIGNGGVEDQCSEDDEVKENIEEKGVREKEDDREEEHDERVGADEEELSEEERDKEDVVDHEHLLKEGEDAEEVNEDEGIDTEDTSIKKEPTLEHWDSLKVNVASPTREITEVSSAESLNEVEVEQKEDDDADEEEEENTEEQDEKPRTTINGPVEVYDDQHNEDEEEEAEEIGREDDNCQSDDSAEDDNDPYQEETRDGDKSDGEEDLKPVPEDEDAESEKEAEDEDKFTVHKNLPVHEDESDLSGRVKELGKIFEGGGPICPKTAKSDSDAVDGPPVSVRKFKAIFETDRYSAEKAREPGRREELSNPPSGIVKNLRGLFENPQGFEGRKG